MLKIGDFSRLTRVSVRMLRYYDDFGLLKPISNDRFTGYRYYSADQMLTVNRIHVLRELGFSLQEMKGLIEKDLDGNELRGLLDRKKQSITETLEIEQNRLSKVEALINLINKESKNVSCEISIKSADACRIVSLRDMIPTYNDEGILWVEMQAYAEKVNLKCTGSCYSIYHNEDDDENGVDVEVAMTITVDVPETDRIKMRELEAVNEMAVIFHKGPFEEMSTAYHALGIWMAENNYEFSGPSRTIQHKGPWCEADPQNFLTEIQAPVRKKQ